MNKKICSSLLFSLLLTSCGGYVSIANSVDYVEIDSEIPTNVFYNKDNVINGKTNHETINFGRYQNGIVTYQKDDKYYFEGNGKYYSTDEQVFEFLYQDMEYQISYSYDEDGVETKVGTAKDYDEYDDFKDYANSALIKYNYAKKLYSLTKDQKNVKFSIQGDYVAYQYEGILDTYQESKFEFTINAKNNKLISLFVSSNKDSNYQIKESYSFLYNEELSIYTAGIKPLSDYEFTFTSTKENLIIYPYLKKLTAESFINCKNLKSISFEEGKSSTDYLCDKGMLFNKNSTILYYYCPKNEINEITLPSTLEVIREKAFTGSNLKSIVVPTTLVKVQENAFKVTNNLTNVYYLGNTEEFNKITVSKGNDNFKDKVLFYSESYLENGWRYVNGIPTKYE